MTKLGMVIDLNRCVGCQTCSNACKMQNNVPMGMLWNRVLTMDSEEIGWCQWSLSECKKEVYSSLLSAL